MAAILRVAEVLESYRGRDKILRLASYSSLLVGGSLKNTKLQGVGQSLGILSKNLNECRTILRLFDDLSMFLHCRRYGLGSKENDMFIQVTTLVSNFFMQSYYPIEHIAWARDHKILTGKSGKLWTLVIFLWLGYLLISIAQSLWLLKTLKNVEDESAEDHKEWYHAKKRQLIVTLIGSLGDACNAINWLPEGILWSGKFSQAVIGLLGTISSSALFYNYLNPVPPKNSKVLSKKS
ncbi:peroxisomal membrane protein 11C [Exaiptasia diaphana]|uniref:Peroxisomal membrane protein 11C n=1 Tax=Exaiptasia diaphana TaxID=2652724 RepID=A0A913X845_EXADI|nr:peroxisomal membrane protein 11C [Exaiptasia diaphana]KXJ14313.1 Peroxisomal membrane protein 11C [Exaiptasia diaphana]